MRDSAGYSSRFYQKKPTWLSTATVNNRSQEKAVELHPGRSAEASLYIRHVSEAQGSKETELLVGSILQACSFSNPSRNCTHCGVQPSACNAFGQPR